MIPTLFRIALGLYFSVFATSRAMTVNVGNADFEDSANNGSRTGSLLSGGSSGTLGNGPWSAKTVGLISLLLAPTATIDAAGSSNGTATISNLAHLSLAGFSNHAAFEQTLAGISIQTFSSYTFSVDLTSTQAVTLSLLTGEGMGIALGTSAGDLLSSSTADPSLVSYSGNTLTLSLQTGASVPTGDLQLRLFAGESSGVLTVGAINSVTFDNVTLSVVAIPEPSSGVLILLTSAAFYLRRSAGRKRVWIA